MNKSINGPAGAIHIRTATPAQTHTNILTIFFNPILNISAIFLNAAIAALYKFTIMYPPY